ncbi:MSHA biogenesis protein MshK [Marinobacter gudaonensis]|uniref:MSHA biogenesis protein MshK n=1 Tax=Marinobacter gudaonensis TaxID=375760 RepID=A0A1I6I051_9GAMM|nr:hypothetical protein [Marinobacter gudaonensis]SFR60067.1 MSHA biogenesis protein MshK [Marinobacter gudaonensis]
MQSWLGLVMVASLSGPAVALQDPTRPPAGDQVVSTPQPERTLVLDSILYSQDRRVAVIEGKALTEGQRFDGVRVIRIYHDHVRVSDSGRERVLYLEGLPQVRGTQ